MQYVCVSRTTNMYVCMYVYSVCVRTCVDTCVALGPSIVITLSALTYVSNMQIVLVCILSAALVYVFMYKLT